ncbi:Ankyrin repeat domain-containing protein 34C [Acipenser ruthenus]|uniref:Ankyrin repeat domain-containing protein 34C n=1 Tax=Acipenser ruthenus TaxID=7906 RepID=A0A444UXP4_ACIRT|nr:Ankyrin repeat domain-containing protein 34C [Acipenser ruthenus]
MGDGGILQTEGNALLKAVFQGKLRLTRLLLEGGAYINEGNERGETPIVAACLAGYEDPQSRQKMVKYLLEKGADPNIPDKSGQTALMHACAEQSGKEVVSMLLEYGADPSMKDYSGSSALVYAINKGDRDTLQVLLDACKAKGKEVIIITTDTSPSGEKRAVPPRKHLKRLNSEPWGLVAPSVLSKANQEQQQQLPGTLRDEENVISELNGMSISGRPILSRRHSIETHDPSSPKPIDRSCSEDSAVLHGSSWADKVQQHQLLYRRNTAPESQETSSTTSGVVPANVRPLAHPRLTRMDHYESDTHLCPESIPGSPDSGRVSVERRKYNTSPLSLLTSSSRESLESIPNSVSPITVRRRPQGLLERRGSGTLLLDRISHTRPGFLPPLNVNHHRPIPDIRANGKLPSPVHSSHKILVPVAPSSPKREPRHKKKLLRRHSMQTEQMKQLSNFQDILAEKMIEFTGD